MRPGAARAASAGRAGPAAARSPARPRARPSAMPISVASTHQTTQTYAAVSSTCAPEPDHRQRREQRRRRRAEQDRRLEEVAEPHRSVSSARSRSRTPSVPVDHRVGLLLELRRRSRPSARRPAARSRAGPRSCSSRQPAEGVEVGHVVADVDRGGEVGVAQQADDPGALVDPHRRADLEHLAAPVGDEAGLLGAPRRPPRPPPARPPRPASPRQCRAAIASLSSRRTRSRRSFSPKASCGEAPARAASRPAARGPARARSSPAAAPRSRASRGRRSSRARRSGARRRRAGRTRRPRCRSACATSISGRRVVSGMWASSGCCDDRREHAVDVEQDGGALRRVPQRLEQLLERGGVGGTGSSMPRRWSTEHGNGWAVGSIDGLGAGPGFRKIRGELGVTAFGVNAIVLPPGYATERHYHERQEELYIVIDRRDRVRRSATARRARSARAASARVDPPTVRSAAQHVARRRGDLRLRRRRRRLRRARRRAAPDRPAGRGSRVSSADVLRPAPPAPAPRRPCAAPPARSAA